MANQDLAKTTPKNETARKRAHTKELRQKLRERKSRRVELRATDEVERIDPTLCSGRECRNKSSNCYFSIGEARAAEEEVEL